MARKIIMEGLPTNIPDLDEPYTICILTKAINIPRGLTIDVSNFTLGSCFDGFCVFQC